MTVAVVRSEDQRAGAVGCDRELEIALVGECLRRYERFASRGLSVGDFSGAVHQLVVETAAVVYAKGAAVTVETVALELQRIGRDAQVGGIRGLAELAAGSTKVPDGDRLRELRQIRVTHEAAQLAARHAEAGDLASALATMAEVDQLGNVRGNRPLTAVELGRAVLSGVQNQAQRNKRRVYLGTHSMRAALGDFPSGGMLIVAADTNVGKSSFILEMMLGIAEPPQDVAQPGTAGLVSMEDPDDVTGARLLGALSGVSSREIQRDDYSMGRQEAYALMGRGVQRLNELGERFLYEDQTGGTELDVCGAMGRMAAMGARLVVVDYVGEVGCSKPQQDRRNEIRVVAKRLKAHARRLGIVLVLVSQITVEKGDANKAPSKHALRESRDLANMAEAIIVLWRSHESDWAEINVNVAKCKWGGVGNNWTVRRSKDSGRLEETGRVQQ